MGQHRGTGHVGRRHAGGLVLVASLSAALAGGVAVPASASAAQPSQVSAASSFAARTRAAALRSAAAFAARTAATAPTVVPALPSTGGNPASVPVPAPGTRNPLPFDLPSAASLRSHPSRMVFAHYWPPLPVSLDNQDPTKDYYQRNYLTPTGEKGKHAAYGGHLRDRPLTRAIRKETSWRLTDMHGEVRQAVAAGLDGFAVCILQLEGDPDVQVWKSTQLIFQAAQAVDPGFKLMLMPDMSGSMHNKTPAVLAKYMALLAANPNAYKLADGRLVVSPFQAESWSVAQWTEFLRLMRETYHKPVAFVPLFQDEQRWSAAFAPISYGMSHWGARNPQWNDPTATTSTSRLGRIRKVHDLGKPWMQPVSVQDARPRYGLFDEALNTTNLRDTWRIAINGGAEAVQLTTWNDYTESTAFAPSTKHGYTFLDLNAYYLTWYKTGKQPAIVRDTVYLTHRSQFVNAQPTFAETKLMRLRGGSPARDTVEALAFLTSAGTVQVQVGGKSYSCALPAGVHACTVPLGLGAVSAAVVRSGTTTTRVTSPVAVTDRPYVQDLAYVGATSGR